MKEVLNIGRLRDKVLTDLANKKLDYYQEIENVIHDDSLSMSDKSSMVIKRLDKIALNNLMVAEWNALTAPPTPQSPVTPQNNNNNE